MGLDVTGYSKLIERPDAERDEDGELIDYENLEEFYENKDFPGRYEGLKRGMAYEIADDGDAEHVGMGYGSYSAWRDELAKLAGYESLPYKGYGGRVESSHCAPCWRGALGPFAEQINFSDCDGTIGPVVAAKLAKDYADFDEKASLCDEYFYERYKLFRRIFELAADGGAVRFH